MKKSSRAPKMRAPENFSTTRSRIISRRRVFCRAWAWQSNNCHAVRRESLAALGQARVQRIAQRIAEQIEAHQGEKNKKSRQKNLQWREKNIGRGVGEQVALARRRRLNAQAEKTQRRFS